MWIDFLFIGVFFRGHKSGHEGINEGIFLLVLEDNNDNNNKNNNDNLLLLRGFLPIISNLINFPKHS